MTAGYAVAGPLYLGNGWQPFPLPHARKAPPPEGFTGAGAATITDEQVAAWVAEFPHGNVGLHLQRGIIGIDIDDYDDKAGAATIARLEQLAGETLPPTLSSTSRGDGASRIRFYRVPPELEFVGDLRHLGGGVEIIQWRHRYAVVSPSIHPDTGKPYRWSDQAGNPINAIDVTPDDCAALPTTFIALLTEQARATQTTAPPRTTSASPAPVGDSIAEWINRSQRWGELLTLDGWTHSHDRGTDQHWTRPGKQRGTSAVLHNAGDGPLVVFSTDPVVSVLRRGASPSSNGDVISLSLFGYVSATRFDGDRSACASAFRTALNAEQARAVAYGGAQVAHKALDAAQGNTGADAGLVGDDVLAEEWPTIEPLGGVDDMLPTFPIDVFPAWISEHIEQVAQELQVPVDLPAMLALTALSTAAAKRAEVFLTRTWREQLCLYLVCALPPGAGKSPAFGQMLGPLTELEIELLADSATRIGEQRTRRAVAEKLYKKAIDNATTGMAEALAAGEELARHVVDAEPRLFVDDLTVEKMGAMMRDQGGRLAIVSTEGGLFDQMAGRYNDKAKASLDPYLQMWSGDTVRVDRIGRDSVIIDKPALTIGITVQPSVLQALAERPELKSRGLTARFMYALPASNVGWRNMTVEAHLADDIAERYHDNLQRLWRSLADLTPPMRIEVDHDAKAMFMAWRQELETQRRPGGDLAPLTEWSTKVESSVVRVAGLLHIAAGKGQSAIDVADMSAALDVGRYWIDHAHAVHQMWSTDDTLEIARRIVAWIRRKSLTEFTIRECYNASRSLTPTADDVVDPLAILVARGYVRTADGSSLSVGRRGVPSQALVVNPLLCVVADKFPSHNRHNHAPMRLMRHRDTKNELSLSISRFENADPPAHEAHEAQLVTAVTLTTESAEFSPEPVDNYMGGVEDDWALTL